MVMKVERLRKVGLGFKGVLVVAVSVASSAARPLAHAISAVFHRDPPPVSGLSDRAYEKALNKSLRGWERLLVLHDQWEPGFSWVSLPKRELYRLDTRARYIRRMGMLRYFIVIVGMLIGGIFGLVAPFGATMYSLFLLSMRGTPMLTDWMSYMPYTVGLGAGIGFVVGIKVMLRFCRMPLTVVRLKGGQFEPVYPAVMLQQWMTVEEGKERPMVQRGSLWYKVSLQPHVRRVFRSKTAARWQKMQYASLVVLALVLCLAIIIWVIALQDSTGSVPNGTSAEERQRPAEQPLKRAFP